MINGPGAWAARHLRGEAPAARVELSRDEVARIDDALDRMDLAVFGGHQGK